MGMLWNQFTQMLSDIGQRKIKEKNDLFCLIRIGQDHSEISHDNFLFLFLEFCDTIKRSKFTPKVIIWLYYSCFAQ